MSGVMREVFHEKRREILIAIGSYNLIWGHTNPRKSLEKSLRKLGMDYIDIFLHLGVVREQDFLCRFGDKVHYQKK
jgi:diketogulonate reductase-like aldo/keto reductase